MKTNRLTIGILIGLTLLSACSSNEDSLKQTEKANETLVENAKPEESGTMAADSESNQKNVAEYMADLSNSSLTELAMSKLAVRRTRNPAIKRYARDLVQQNTVGRSELMAQAKQYRILLPTTLSNDSQAMVKQLQEEPDGAKFDRRYLDRMAQLNDAASGKGKRLVGNIDKPALASFVQDLMAANEQNMDKATELKGTIK